MAKHYASSRNAKFLVHEVHDLAALTKHPYFAHHDRESFDMMIDAAFQLADTHLFPYFADMDRNEPELKDGVVKVHPQVKNIIRALAEGGWINATVPLAEGGMQLPESINALGQFIFQAANNSAMPFTGLTAGAANLIRTFGSDYLKQTYMERMYAGEWQGTMALTEPQAGSSLSDIVTTAEPVAEGVFKIKGQKIFISAGDLDALDNVVHLLLARIKGAPAGTKGISLFVVPKKRVVEGKLVDNDVLPAGIYHKMGQKATPAMHLMLGENDNCFGYLVGEPNKGLSYMFQMMNEARILVGITAAAIASAAYHASLEYAKERPQGRRLNEKNPLNPPTLIINHPDVRRLLLFQKSVVEGSLSLLLETAKYADLAHVSQGEEQANHLLMLELLTPVAKTYPAEAGIASVSAGLQCLGGYGFCKDFPLEQLYRDIRITAIYEGTTAIQSLDLLGRKLTMHNGKAGRLYIQAVSETIGEAAVYDALKKYAAALEHELKNLQKVTAHLMEIAQKGDAELFLADATLYMELFSLNAIAWQWLKQGTAAHKALLAGAINQEETAFYESKLQAMKYFFHYELPKTQGLTTRLTDSEVITIAQQKELLV
ncbi:MAG: acyl-CoA dehydrogenase [Cytophagales bacterium]|nr:acyl-CoA dehydrogenase [Bernardetiaceae bacterium]MDW8203695.1 acyl-CoA dehydrogenase [Cytophagales bacterium]